MEILSDWVEFLSFSIEEIEAIFFEVKLRLFLKYHGVCWTSEHEVSELLSFLDVLSDLYSLHTAWNFSHTNKNDSNSADLFVVRFDNNYFSGSNSTQEWLAVIWGAFIVFDKLRLI